MDIEFDEALAVLVDREGKDFYATMATCLPRRASKSVATMGLTVTEGSYELLYNPEGIKKLSPREFIYSLHHEMVHLENKHVPRTMMKYAEEGVQKLDDVPKELKDQCLKATDFAVNGQMRKINGRSGYVQHMLNESEFTPLLPEQDGIDNMPASDFESYLEVLKLLAVPPPPTPDEGEGDEEGNDKGDGLSSAAWGENHNEWGKNNSRNKEGDVQEDDGQNTASQDMSELAQALEDETDQIIQSAAEAVQKSRGTIPAHLQQRLKEMRQKYRVPWQAFLLNIIRTKIALTMQRSVQRPKRRSMDPSFFLPGKIKDKTFHAVFMMDTSASVSNEELKEAFALLKEFFMQEEGMTLTAIQADTRITKEWTVTADETWVDVDGRGGTTFDPAIIRCCELEPDLAFYYTDGYAPCPAKEIMPQCPFIWMISKHGSGDAYNLSSVGTVVTLKGLE